MGKTRLRAQCLRQSHLVSKEDDKKSALARLSSLASSGFVKSAHLYLEVSVDRYICTVNVLYVLERIV